MKKVNIEFSHIYSHESFGPEQIQSIEQLKEVIRENKLDDYSTTILIDDYHSPNNEIDYLALVDQIKNHKIHVDFIAFESKFCNLVNELICSLPSSCIKTENFKSSKKKVVFFKKNNVKIPLMEFSDSHQKVTCVALTCVWILCRLGHFKFPEGSIVSFSTSAPISKQIIGVLPNKYKHSENKVLEVLKESTFHQSVNQIGYNFF